MKNLKKSSKELEKEIKTYINKQPKNTQVICKKLIKMLVSYCEALRNEDI